MKFDFLVSNIAPSGVKIKRAKGVRLWDEDNKEYLDFCSQTLNLNLGNAPDIIKRAFLDQFEKFTYLSSRFESEPFIELGRLLVDRSPSSLTKVNVKLTNGSDANESAFKRARTYRQKPMIVSFYWSHLGETSETLAANGKHFKDKYFSGSNNFIHIEPPFSLMKKGLNRVKSEERILNQLEFIFSQRKDIAAIILEPVMVNAGGYIFSKSFLKQLRLLCDRYKISLIYDEIQTAFGWLGALFGADYFGVIPDLMTLGKGLGCGFPLAAVLMKEEYDVVGYGLDEYTYGGHPISCAIALANIKYLLGSGILEKVKNKAKYLAGKLEKTKEKFSHLVSAIRFLGLIGSIEFKTKNDLDIAVKIYDEAIKQGLLTRKSMDGKGPSLVLKPPIIVSEADIDKAFIILDKAISSYVKKRDF